MLSKKDKKKKDRVDKLLEIIEQGNKREEGLVEHLKSLEMYIEHLESMLFSDEFTDMEGIEPASIEDVPEEYREKIRDKFPKTKTYTMDQILESLKNKKDKDKE